MSQRGDSTLTPTTHFNLLKSFHLPLPLPSRGLISTTTAIVVPSPSPYPYVTRYIPTLLPREPSHETDLRSVLPDAATPILNRSTARPPYRVLPVLLPSPAVGLIRRHDDREAAISPTPGESQDTDPTTTTCYSLLWPFLPESEALSHIIYSEREPRPLAIRRHPLFLSTNIQRPPAPAGHTNSRQIETEPHHVLPIGIETP